MTREAWQETLRRLSAEEFQILREAVWEEARAREAQHLSNLRIGDWVEFEDRHGRKHRGTVTRINARTVSVDCDSGEPDGHPHHWRVAASLARRIVSAETPMASLSAGHPDAELLSSQPSRENPG
ncbi:MAG: mechanosensitive ion channel domain-containing protein [Thermoplasmata archaeon]